MMDDGPMFSLGFGFDEEINEKCGQRALDFALDLLQIFSVVIGGCVV